MAQLRSFLSLPAVKKTLIVQAVFLLPLCQLCVKYIHFKKLIKIFGLTPFGDVPKTSSTDQENAILIQWVINRTSTLPLPIRPRCLAQALTARILLQKKGATTVLSIGATIKDSSMAMAAHAWLYCGDIIVTGEEEMGEYTQIASYF